MRYKENGKEKSSQGEEERKEEQKVHEAPPLNATKPPCLDLRAVLI
ncbi:MAG: hypothetical protein HYV68_01585 [Candidatus Taylorbacteria bacterium]|nr:hypothetical protein [Candidatus Taylorbacteria bacterium]